MEEYGGGVPTYSNYMSDWIVSICHEASLDQNIFTICFYKLIIILVKIILLVFFGITLYYITLHYIVSITVWNSPVDVLVCCCSTSVLLLLLQKSRWRKWLAWKQNGCRQLCPPPGPSHQRTCLVQSRSWPAQASLRGGGGGGPPDCGTLNPTISLFCFLTFLR